MLSATALLNTPRPAWSWSEGDIAPIAQITLEAEAAQRPTTGVTASIAFKNGKRWSGAAGSADKDGSKKMVATDQMRIGSQTKTYTGTVILQMVEEGKISLDDKLQAWLPALNVDHDREITIRMLLDMTSGVPDYLTGPAAALHGGGCPKPSDNSQVLDEWVRKRGLMTATPAELVAAANCQANTGLGTMAYSNTNFVLLGMIAEKIAGCGEAPPPSCYIDELKRRVLSRVPGLKGTTFPDDADFPQPPFSGGYARAVAKQPIEGASAFANPDADEYVEFTHVKPQVPWTAGAMISTAEDELIWSSQLATNEFRLLSLEMQAKRVTETNPGSVAYIPAQYGLGIYYMQSMLNNKRMLGHAGSIFGYTSDVFRRLDNETDYAANVATFLLTDQFTAPALVWILDRNVWGAIESRGNCGSNAKPAPYQAICTGDSVRLSSLAVARALTLQPSGKSYDTYVPTADGLHSDNANTPVPTLASYGHHQSALALGGSATLKIEPSAALALVGNQSAAISVKGARNTVSIEGSVAASGRDVTGLRDTGTGNTMTVDGQVNSSVVWWNPDQQLPGTPSTQMVATDRDVSTAIDLAGRNGKLTVDGIVQTQRIKTKAVQVRREARGYALSIGPQGAVVGPIVLAGTGNSLSIAPGGRGLYVSESRALAPQTALLTAAPGQSNSFVLRNVPLTPPTNQFVSAAAPGLPPIRRPLPVPRDLTTAAPTESLSLSPPPPSMLALQGRGNAVKIDGTLIGAIPKEFQSAYTKDVVAVDERGSGNTLTIGQTGTVIGDIILRGRGTRLRLDGTAKGDVKITGASTVIEGNGRIEGKLTINGTTVSQQGNLKFGPAP
ncbi:serine hydrolase [uncultured Bradyrhizobium sp.]|uniref:serine hydrolase n=1 Tax=uncultured Bradyrhizobium sp. TaxID=199684 RepID=UPI0035CA6F58